jgi:hypothetical protein
MFIALAIFLYGRTGRNTKGYNSNGNKKEDDTLHIRSRVKLACGPTADSKKRYRRFIIALNCQTPACERIKNQSLLNYP